MSSERMYLDPGHTDGVVGRSLPNGFVEVRLVDGMVCMCFPGPELKASRLPEPRIPASGAW